MKLLILVFCYFLNISVALDWPSYVPRCSLSDPKWNECLIEKANLVIPQIVKGDPTLEIPVLSPVQLAEAKLEGANLKVLLFDVSGYGLENLKITNGFCDFKQGKAGFTATADQLIARGNYSIDNSQVQGRSLLGKGYVNFTLTDNRIFFNTDFSLTKIDGEAYIRVNNSEASLKIGSSNFFFENLTSPVKGDVNEFINKNRETVLKELTPSMEGYLLHYILLPIKAFQNKFPMNTIFLP